MRSLLVTTAIAVIGAFFLAFADKHAPNSLRKRGLQIVDPRTVDLKQLADNHDAAQANFSPLCRADQPDSWKNELFCRLDRIRIACGELCTINDRESLRSRQIPNPSGDFPRIEAEVDCDSIFATDDIDAGDPSVPFPPPEELVPFYTMDGLIDLIPDKRLENVYLGGRAFRNVWTREKVEEQMASVAEGTLHGSYGPEVTNQVRDTLRKMDLEGKSVLVIGSEQSWLEAICLYLGAASVTTLEYGEIESQHPKIQTLTPEVFRKKYQDGTLGQFDRIVSYSSIEHAGLGRYGDALNPWGDVLAVARAWCVTKPDGQMYMAVPSGPDRVQFNPQRMYGPNRWSLFTANWIQTLVGPPIGPGTGHIFKKVEPSSTN